VRMRASLEKVHRRELTELRDALGPRWPTEQEEQSLRQAEDNLWRVLEDDGWSCSPLPIRILGRAKEVVEE
jgi:hypothetical protein